MRFLTIKLSRSVSELLKYGTTHETLRSFLVSFDQLTANVSLNSIPLPNYLIRGRGSGQHTPKNTPSLTRSRCLCHRLMQKRFAWAKEATGRRVGGMFGGLFGGKKGTTADGIHPCSPLPLSHLITLIPLVCFTRSLPRWFITFESM